MKLKPFISIALLLLAGCTPQAKDSYCGYIYLGQWPIKNIKVMEAYTNNYTDTNDKGYFKLSRKNTDTRQNAHRYHQHKTR